MVSLDVAEYLPMSAESYIFPISKSYCMYGVGVVRKVGAEAKRLCGDGAAVLLVSDRGVQEAGLTNTVTTLLKEEGLRVETYSEIAGEPTLESARKLVSFVRQHEFDGMIGLGGGSVMDHTKASAIMATNPGDIKDYLSLSEDRAKKTPLPFILIPTTAGTGSEISMGAVITDDTGLKNFLHTSPSRLGLADVAIVDPLMTITCPPRQTAGSGMDALSHALEDLVNNNSSPYIEALSLQAIRLVFDSVATAYYRGDSIDARYKMSLAATLAGLTMIAGCNIGHCISEIIGPRYKIPHGIACGITIPYVMDYNLPASTDALVWVARSIGEETAGLSKREVACKAVKRARTLLDDLELPVSLSEVNVPREDLDEIAKLVVEERQFSYQLPRTNPRKLSMKNVTGLLINMWDGNYGHT